jgi:hypothetical protein
MGKQGNPFLLEAPWLVESGYGIRVYLTAYALLAVIHDNVLPNCPSIAKEVLPKELANKIWRDLITGANEEHSIGSRWVIPTGKIEGFFQDVKADIENHLAPGNKTEQKPAEPKQDNKPPGKAGQGEPTSSGNKAGETQRADGLTGEALALAMLVEHPDWSDTKIAKAVGVNRTTLYDWPNFKKAKEALKQGKKELPRGSKNGETGDMEAWGADTSADT